MFRTLKLLYCAGSYYFNNSIVNKRQQRVYVYTLKFWRTSIKLSTFSKVFATILWCKNAFGWLWYLKKQDH